MKLNDLNEIKSAEIMTYTVSHTVHRKCLEGERGFENELMIKRQVFTKCMNRNTKVDCEIHSVNQYLEDSSSETYAVRLNLVLLGTTYQVAIR